MESNKATKRHTVEDQTSVANETTEAIKHKEITDQGKVIELTPEEFIQREETSTNELPVVETEKQSSAVEDSPKQPKKFNFPKTEGLEENGSKAKWRVKHLIESGKQTINNFDREETLEKAKNTSSKLFKNIQKGIGQLKNRK
ncbi:MAG: hypothetical protein QM571_03190 [Micrococcaceae bacterium]